MLRRRLTYANVMATVAVFVALGGSSYAALSISGSNVKNRSLTAKDFKKNSLTSAEVRNRSLLAKDFKAGQLPAGKQGSQGLQGIQGVAGAPGTARAWAHVLDNGTVESSKNMEVAREGTGQHCLKTPFTPKVVIVTPDWPGNANRLGYGGLGGFGSCATDLPGTNAFAVIQDATVPTVQDTEFFVMVDG
jgi:hypothetical protein